MSNFNLDILKSSFHQALSNPQALDLDTFDQLLKKYPYSQPLQFAYQRKQFLASNNYRLTKVLLYAPSNDWLKEFIESDEIYNESIEKEGLQNLNSEINASVEELSIPTDAIEEESTNAGNEVKEVEDHENDSLEKMIQEGIGSSNYFALDDKDSVSIETISTIEEEEKEDVSLYNDELMPYSFRWWLHKTRLEYADTYQPFANHGYPKPVASQFDAGKLDVALLDQQIKQHIFHLQSPEDKLSDEVKQKTVQFTPAKKTDEVIERFIREEPQIHPPALDALNTENKARKSSEEQYTLVTETLGNIYIEQGLYPKAIEVFTKLIVRFPEKKSYFAHRIKELEDKF